VKERMVRFLWPSHRSTLFWVVSDTLFFQQWYLRNVSCPAIRRWSTRNLYFLVFWSPGLQEAVFSNTFPLLLKLSVTDRLTPARTAALLWIATITTGTKKPRTAHTGGSTCNLESQNSTLAEKKTKVIGEAWNHPFHGFALQK
jgi:hypothetical protein